MLAQMVVSYLMSIWQCEQTILTQVIKSHHIKMYYNVSACHFSSWLIMLWLAASHDCSYTTKNLTTGNRHGQENHTGAECPGPAAILRPPSFLFSRCSNTVIQKQQFSPSSSSYTLSILPAPLCLLKEFRLSDWMYSTYMQQNFGESVAIFTLMLKSIFILILVLQTGAIIKGILYKKSSEDQIHHSLEKHRKLDNWWGKVELFLFPTPYW